MNDLPDGIQQRCEDESPYIWPPYPANPNFSVENTHSPVTKTLPGNDQTLNTFFFKNWNFQLYTHKEKYFSPHPMHSGGLLHVLSTVDAVPGNDQTLNTILL